MSAEVERYAEQLAYVRKLQGVARSLATSRRFQLLREKICLTFLARATVASESVCVLFSSGLDADARSISRTIAELAIDLAWLLDRPGDERPLLFIEYIHVLNHRREASIEVLSRHAGHVPDAQRAFDKSGAAGAGFRTPEEFAAFRKAEYERVKSRYQRKSQWNSADVASRAREVGLEVLYETVFRTGSDAVHSGPGTMTTLLRETDDGRSSIVIGPAPPEDNTTLVGTAWGFLFLVEKCTETLDPGRSTANGRLFGDD
jgi:hypothetical protein